MNNSTPPTPPTIQDTTVDHTQDIEAIRGLIANIQTAVNSNDVEGAVQPFAANGSAVTVGGARSIGHDALLEAHRAAFTGPLRDVYARYEVTDMTFIAPDIAIAFKHARGAQADGTLIDHDPAMIALYVLAKRDGHWWIVARQNTLISPPSTSAG